nr:MAG TPA: hypothetical protein [Caudoviricetes sp.]DAU68733.1 MAG TPA: hypothetical protein [Caudoviricetes sp.]
MKSNCLAIYLTNWIEANIFSVSSALRTNSF